MSTNPSFTVAVHPAEIWGPRWRGVEAMFEAWAKLCVPERTLPQYTESTTVQLPGTTHWDMNIYQPPFDSVVEKVRRHPDPKYRK